MFGRRKRGSMRPVKKFLGIVLASAAIGLQFAPEEVLKYKMLLVGLMLFASYFLLISGWRD